MEEENELLDDEEFADGDIIEFLRGLMQFFASAVTTLQTLVVALGAGLAVWGVVNLLEGYGSDNAAAKSQGIKQFMAN